MEINQFVPGASLGDAITHFSNEIKDILSSYGPCQESHIFSDFKHTPTVLKQKYTSYKEYEGNPENIAIYHFGIGSDVTEFFRSLPDKKILIYHNITPPVFFRNVAPDKADVLEEGAKQIQSLMTCVDLALGVSEFNCNELKRLGFKETGILPLILDTEYFSKAPDKTVLNKYPQEGTKIAAVGRIAPNKKLEDVIKIFYYFQKCYDPRAMLFLVGSYGGMMNYYMYLTSLINKMGLNNVVFSGHVSQSQLISYYKLAEVFMTMSEHEGFCIPVLEAFNFNLPVIAFDSSAIPETLGGAGILVKEKNYPDIAEVIHTVLKSPEIIKKLNKKGKTRLKEFSKENVKKVLFSFLDELKENG